MKNNAAKRIALSAACILLSLLQPAALQADEANRGIGGIGHSATESGVGGTGNSTEGIGGTGHAESSSGIGGTGIVADKAGIGGTGHSQGDGGIGGTGIVGIVTGFGSIWVNGLEVQYDAKTQVAGNTAATTSNDLAIGQVVVIEAQGGNNMLQANKISVIDAVAGQISAVDAANGKLTVLGQTVSTTAQTRTHDPQGAMQFNAGDHVKVNGLRLANGEIVASRIERTVATVEPNLVGPITGINGNMIEVYGLQISAAANNGLSVGQEISVKGSLSGGILTAREITPSPTSQLYGRTEYINVQGYVGTRTAEGQIKVGNLEVVVADPALISRGKLDALSPGELVQISGRFANDHRVIADRIEFSRDRPERAMHERGGEHEREGRAEHAEHAERSEHAERPGHSNHIDRPDRPDRSDHSDAEKHSDHSHH